MKSILDPSFRYTKSVDTDLRKTFARIQRELRKQQKQHVGGSRRADAKGHPLSFVDAALQQHAPKAAVASRRSLWSSNRAIERYAPNAQPSFGIVALKLSRSVIAA